MLAPFTPYGARQMTGYGVPVCWLGLGDEVAEKLHDQNAGQKRDQHLPANQPEREQAARRDIAADAVHVRHPEGEDIVGAPGLLLERREIGVGQT
jgi:hypothetical protein